MSETEDSVQINLPSAYQPPVTNQDDEDLNHVTLYHVCKACMVALAFITLWLLPHVFALYVGITENCDNGLSIYLIITASITLTLCIYGFIYKQYHSDYGCMPHYIGIFLVLLFGLHLFGMMHVWPYQKNRCSDLLYFTAFIYTNMWWWLFCILCIIVLIFGSCFSNNNNNNRPVNRIIIDVDDAMDDD